MHSWYEGGASLRWEVTPDVDDTGAAVCEPGVLLLSSNDVILPSKLTEKIGGSSIPDILDSFSSVVCDGGNIMKLVAATVLKSWSSWLKEKYN